MAYHRGAMGRGRLERGALGRRDPGPPAGPERDHGPHTLRIVPGEIAGVFRDDVFVDLGPRMQGVLSVGSFEEPPRVGEVHAFTLRGQEGGLWALSLVPRPSESHATWRDMEPGSQVQARVIGARPDGAEVKIGPLHGFLPRSHTGLARGADLRVLVGKTFPCEVLEVDPEKERVLVSRKLVLQRERGGERERSLGALVPGQIVSGRVARLERYGAFVRFGQGLTGLVHVADIAQERPAHPADVLSLGQAVEARVLAIRRAGRRIALGLKQLRPSPWKDLGARYRVDQLVAGRVTRVVPFGAFVALEPGVEGLLHRSELGLEPQQSPRAALRAEQQLVLRIVALDPGAERLSLSLLHRSGSRVRAEELAAQEALPAHLAGPEPEAGPLGSALARALERARRPGPAGGS